MIFDFDGVLVDSHGIINKLFTAAFNKELGLRIKEREFARFPGMRFEKRVEKLAMEKGIEISQEQIEKALKHAREEYYHSTSSYVMLFPGVKRLLDELKKAGFKIGLGSNGNRRNIEKILALQGIIEYFISIVTYEDVSLGKPSPHIFLKNAEQLKVKPEECVVIEDSAEGILAAKNAGMKVIAVMTTSSPASLKEADLVVKRVNDLNPYKILTLND